MIIIKQANKSDETELTKLDKTIFNNANKDSYNFNYELTSNNRIYYIAYNNFNAIGFVGATLAPDFSDIMKIGVIEKYRGKGVGGKLLKTILNKLKEIKVQYVMLEVRQSNTNAIKLYEAFQFKKISERLNYYLNGENAYIYKLNL